MKSVVHPLFEEKILDGRNRYRACLEAKVEPRFIEYEGDDPIGHIVSLNEIRRQLTVGERAIAAEKLANLKWGQRVDYAEGTLGPSAPKTLDSVANKLGVNVRLVKRVRRVRTQGSDSMFKAVRDGKIPVSTAEAVITLPKDEQDALVAEGMKAVSQKGEGRQ